MTFGQKLKEIRQRMGLSQEQLAQILHVSRQAITKWENEVGLPDISNLQELSKVFGISVDFFLNNENHLPLLIMKKKLEKENYKNKISAYFQILKEYYPEPWQIFVLAKSPRMGKLETALDFVTGGDYWLIKDVSDLSPYYLVTKDHIKLLVNIQHWTLQVIELSPNTNTKKFIYQQNTFRNCGKLKNKSRSRNR